MVISRYKYLALLAMLNTTIMLITVILIYKVVALGTITVSASTFIIPIWYFLQDIVAEVYGYKVSRQIIWFALICQFVFAMICYYMIKLPSPSFWHDQHAYDLVLGKLPRVFLGSMMAILTGAFINIYIITKWKILLKGKLFWLRSIGSTAIGEIIFTVVAFSIEFIGIAPFSEIIELILTSYIIKLLIAPIAVIPSAIAAKILKILEGVDVYDDNTNFNPFKLSVENEEQENVSQV